MPRGIPKGPVNRLGQKEMYRLVNFVKERYAASGLNDKAFAAASEADFGIPLTVGNITSAREILDLPNNHAKGRGHEDSALTARVASLESRLAALEQRVEVYVKGCRSDVGAKQASPHRDYGILGPRSDMGA